MSKLILLLAAQILLLTTIVSAANGGDFAKTVDRKHILKKEKLTHLRVYWHDILSGQNPTAVRINQSVKNSSTAFGLVTMMDNALTSDVPINSTVVGRSQGFYAGAAQRELGFLMAMNFVFGTGKYNGSTITILGRNKVFSDVREMPIVGGSGMFRFARGYVEARTKWFDQKSGDATVEYNCYVMHY